MQDYHDADGAGEDSTAGFVYKDVNAEGRSCNIAGDRLARAVSGNHIDGAERYWLRALLRCGKSESSCKAP